MRYNQCMVLMYEITHDPGHMISSQCHPSVSSHRHAQPEVTAWNLPPSEHPVAKWNTHSSHAVFPEWNRLKSEDVEAPSPTLLEPASVDLSRIAAHTPRHCDIQPSDFSDYSTLPSSSVLANHRRCYRMHNYTRFCLFFLYIHTWKCMHHYAKIDRLYFAIVSLFQGYVSTLIFSRNMKSTIFVVIWSIKSEIFTVFSNNISKAIFLHLWIIWALGNIWTKKN